MVTKGKIHKGKFMATYGDVLQNRKEKIQKKTEESERKIPKKVKDKKKPYRSGDYMFENPGSALRKSSKYNPRNLPCPTCRKPNRLTPADKARGYQCDECADRAEGIY